ncbi:hypothetical protein FB99_12550 [Pantoea agglomerans]|nr:hypothetical protein FB99_12550 [Pantoea agglomerans]
MKVGKSIFEHSVKLLSKSAYLRSARGKEGGFFAGLAVTAF